MLGLTWVNALAKISSRFLPLLPDRGASFPEDEGRPSNCGLCLDILALVGDAKDGLLPGVDFAPSLRTGIRLGVAGASPGTDVVGDVLRLFEGEDSIIDFAYTGYPSLYPIPRSNSRPVSIYLEAWR